MWHRSSVAIGKWLTFYLISANIMSINCLSFAHWLFTNHYCGNRCVQLKCLSAGLRNWNSPQLFLLLILGMSTSGVDTGCLVWRVWKWWCANLLKVPQLFLIPLLFTATNFTIPCSIQTFSEPHNRYGFAGLTRGPLAFGCGLDLTLYSFLGCVQLLRFILKILIEKVVLNLCSKSSCLIN